MRRFIKTFKNSLLGKILKTVFKVLLWILEIIIVFIALVIVTQRVTKDQSAFLGFRIYNVATRQHGARICSWRYSDFS